MSNPTGVYKGGLTPIRMIDGSPINMALRTYFVSASDATALFVGDLVKAGTGTFTNNPLYAPTVTQSANGDSNTMGVVVSVDPIIAYQAPNIGLENFNRQYRPASTAGYVTVCVDSRVVFEIQASTGSALTAAQIANATNTDIIVAAGITATGQSQMTADIANAATTSTFPLRIIGFSSRVGNDPTSANPLLEVVLNTVQPMKA